MSDWIAMLRVLKKCSRVRVFGGKMEDVGGMRLRLKMILSDSESHFEGGDNREEQGQWAKQFD